MHNPVPLFPRFEGGEAVRQAAGAVEELGDGFGEVGRRGRGEQIVGAEGGGHGALAGFLQAAKVDALICGGIGMGARMALAEAGIRLHAGVQGSADAAARALVAGTLECDPEAHCDHHGHHHDGECTHDHCADHHCHGN